jgi:hypothetical protein
VVAHTCDPVNVGGQDRRIENYRPAWAT